MSEPKLETSSKFQRFIDKYYWYLFAGLAALLVFLCFFNLGVAQVRSFDESRHGSNAYEMMQRDNYIANYYNGNLDYWNLKPPLSFYLVMLGYRLCGYNAWGLRFFSAVCYLALALIATLYLRKRLGKFSSLLGLVMFCGNYLLFFYHGVRSGDADSAYLLCFGIALIALEISSRKPILMSLTGFMFALAFLLKSWHAFVLAPIVLLAYILNKQYKTMKVWHYLAMVAAAVLPILIWVIARYNFDGITFFREMFEYDLLQRSENVLEANSGYPFYYTAFFIYNFVEFFCLIICIIGIVLKIKTKQKFSSLEKICMVAFITVFAIYAIAKTKLYWYTYPCCVPLFLCAVSMMPQIMEKLINREILKRVYKICCCFVLSACVLVSIILVTIRASEHDQLQHFITTFEITDCAIYYQDQTATIPTQNTLLCLQWETHSNISAGGFAEFLNQPGAYILVSREYVDGNGPLPADISIAKENADYLLLRNDK